MNDIFIHEKIWNTFSTEQMDTYVEKVFHHYRTHGFPHFVYDRDENIRKFKRMLTKDYTNLLRNKTIKQTMAGLDIAWSYFPHAWDIQTSSHLTPMQVFNDDSLFREAIRKRIKLGDAISDNMIRKVLCIFKNVKRVSNFRPTAAACIYDNLGGGVVYDFSAGFGGRLLGALISKSVTEYIGTDPSRKTFTGLAQMREDFQPHTDKIITLFDIPSEELIIKKEADICFTSPPYVDTEKYAWECTQSFIRYRTYQDWIDQYLTTTLKNVHLILKEKGILAINIANTVKYPRLCNDFLRAAAGIGFELIDTWALILSQVSKRTGYKTEPVFILRKK